eukprot:11957522-Ditylum_brightwellii.AAC.1
MKVRSDGYVALIHEPGVLGSGSVTEYVSKDKSQEYISVPWERSSVTLNEFFPRPDNDCGQGACSQLDTNTCLCGITLTEEAIFSGTDLPSRENVLSNCYIGAFDPTVLTGYDLFASSNGVEVHVLGSETQLSTSAIFKVIDEYGNTIFLKNLKSTIQWGEYQEDDARIGVTRTLRNVPNFNDLLTPELRDAQYEVDAFLDMLLKYPSTAPNICKLLIQHLAGISNPSPQYISEVATAFKEGIYIAETVTFGQGKYGDLRATSAAILLHREATTTVLDADPTYGSLREPISKVLKYMRSLEYTRTPQDKMIYPILDEMNLKVGQE